MKLSLEDKIDKAFEHFVLLGRQAIKALRATRRLSGLFPYLFHSVRSPPKPSWRACGN